MIIGLNLRDGISQQRPKMYVSSFKMAAFGGSGERKDLIYVVTAFHHEMSKNFSSRSACGRIHLNRFEMK